MTISDADRVPPWLHPRAAYIHIPFCTHHCGYCDFAIAVGKDDLQDRYLDALAAELATLGTPQPVQTLFLGGGTPTYLSADRLHRLLTDVRRWLPPMRNGECGMRNEEGSSIPHSAFPIPHWEEFSIEANPGTLDADKVAVLADHGVNRVSLGAQSFHPHLLRVLERDHAPADVARAVETVRRRIANVSIDLIFGAPGQTLDQWRQDLDWALRLEPDHVSTYGLTYEKGTPLWKQRQRGEVTALGEDDERALYAAAMDTLGAAGFGHYEISNFAHPRRECRHNEIYWANWAYYGFGMGAARYVGGRREINTRDLRTYIRKALAGEAATFQSEELEPRERARETMAVQLRRTAGIDRAAFREQTGHDLDALAGPAVARHVELGLLADDGTGVRLTREGKFVADAVIERLL